MAITLSIEDSKKFIENMIKKENEPISKKDKKLAAEIRNNMQKLMPKKKIYKVVFEYYIETDDEKKIIDFIKAIEQQAIIRGEVKIEMINVNEK